MLDRLLARYDDPSSPPKRSPSSEGWRSSLESAGSGAGEEALLLARDDALRRKAREPDPRTFALIAAPRRNEIGRAYRNGAVTLSVWMAPDAGRRALAHQVGVEVLPGALCWVYIVSCGIGLPVDRTEHCTYITATPTFPL